MLESTLRLFSEALDPQKSKWKENFLRSKFARLAKILASLSEWDFGWNLSLSQIKKKVFTSCQEKTNFWLIYEDGDLKLANFYRHCPIFWISTMTLQLGSGSFVEHLSDIFLLNSSLQYKKLSGSIKKGGKSEKLVQYPGYKISKTFVKVRFRNPLQYLAASVSVSVTVFYVF